MTRYAIDFIRENKEHPFFCYVPFHIAHGPLQAKENDLAVKGARTSSRMYSAVRGRPFLAEARSAGRRYRSGRGGERTQQPVRREGRLNGRTSVQG